MKRILHHKFIVHWVGLNVADQNALAVLNHIAKVPVDINLNEKLDKEFKELTLELPLYTLSFKCLNSYSLLNKQCRSYHSS